jgi:redox-sensitive bicupin YhaK (pirin superfamily)
MSAGSGVVHSEYNHSRTEPVHFLQIWIQPNTENDAPGYEEKHFDRASKLGRLRLIASPDGREGSVSLRQDASIYAGILTGADEVAFPLVPDRHAYLHVIRGKVEVNGVPLAAGDAVHIAKEESVLLAKAQDSEVLLFDLPY